VEPSYAAGLVTIAAIRDAVAGSPGVLGVGGYGTIMVDSRNAVLLNLLSVGAVFGVMVFVWQDGHGTEPLWGLPGTGAVTTWVPLFTFAFLFGLSMDYEVFLPARMREAHERGSTTDEAIIEDLGRVEDLGRTGRLISSAALGRLLRLPLTEAGTGPCRPLARGADRVCPANRCLGRTRKWCYGI
jgi:uncharacterized membrane protein YdfJ with MMPL/SSD domain